MVRRHLLVTGAIAGAIEGTVFRLHLLVAGTIAGAIEGAIFRCHLLVAGAVSQTPLEALVAGAIRGAIYRRCFLAVCSAVLGALQASFLGSPKVPFQALIQRS